MKNKLTYCLMALAAVVKMNRGKAIALEYLFGKEMFEEDKK